MRALYQEDAGRLALRRLREMRSPALDEIALPADLVQSLYDALARVYNASELPTRDSVVSVYRIHTFSTPDVLRLIVLVSDGTEWAAAWRRGERLTGHPVVDSLLLEWDLSLDRYYAYGSLDYDAVSLLAPGPLNMFALGDRFEAIEGVRGTHPFAWCCDGDDITALPQGDTWFLSYSIGRGDCPAGCTYRQFWTFRVTRDGTVTFVAGK